MLEHIADFTAWPILTGIFIGYIANRIMSGEGKGCCMNLFVGVVGSYAGTFISHLLNIELFGKGFLTNFVFCLLGAVVMVRYAYWHNGLPCTLTDKFFPVIRTYTI